jgi:hypothetical protein
MVLELSDLLSVDVDHHHVVAKVGKASCSGQAHITAADHCNFAQCRPIIS